MAIVAKPICTRRFSPSDPNQPPHSTALDEDADESRKCEHVSYFLDSEWQSVMQGHCCSAKSAKPEKNVLKANVKAKNCHNNGPSCAVPERFGQCTPIAKVPGSSSGWGCGATDGSRK